MTERESVQPWMKAAAMEFLQEAHPDCVADLVRELSEIIAEHAKEKSAPDLIARPFSPMPEDQAAHTAQWLRSNEKKPADVRWSLYPIGMVGRWIERAICAEKEQSAPDQLHIALCQACELLNQGDSMRAHLIIRQALSEAEAAQSVLCECEPPKAVDDEGYICPIHSEDEARSAETPANTTTSTAEDRNLACSTDDSRSEDGVMARRADMENRQAAQVVGGKSARSLSAPQSAQKDGK